MTNCPNCGAPIASSQCEYCGTILYDHRRLEIEKAMLELENEVLNLKTRYLHEQNVCRDLYEEAIKAMRSYSYSY